MTRRVGILYINEEWYQDDFAWEIIAQLKLKPLEVTYEVAQGRYKWICEGEQFPESIPGQIPMSYIVSCTNEMKPVRTYSLI